TTEAAAAALLGHDPARAALSPAALEAVTLGLDASPADTFLSLSFLATTDDAEDAAAAGAIAGPTPAPPRPEAAPLLNHPLLPLLPRHHRRSRRRRGRRRHRRADARAHTRRSRAPHERPPPRLARRRAGGHASSLRGAALEQPRLRPRRPLRARLRRRPHHHA